ncbi:phosphatidate cytidylyltransferase family protein [Cryptosporidium muris RN66]|uniref:Phosphatidate cytidylyltransferase n=1 Tax=Cryptosporidium muris (strain RN66) TaxID=441375 RepID=B6AHM5_CRYMR|nr:phosphatidate cytidylyltransferase family protein [Cryptosporidium muris RN66]EEA07720.1 phosphatidate cytidylyltransferase family protein [Cryptosporidium muris RN66]|eukprot:XP_002142069.1 phosphatidate cytidylyltransferase family protein [Cryptosporidium muris RN66]
MKFRNNNGDMKKGIGIFDDTELETESETCRANKKGKLNSGNSSKNLRYSVYTANQKMSQGTNLMTRTLWTIILLSTFFVILAAGHTYSSILVLILTSAVYQEVISLKRSNEEDKHLPLFYTLRWYWFGVTLFATGKLWWIPLIVIYRDSCTLFNIVLSYHSIISYSAALLGLIAFILSLRRYTLKYQFSQFGIMILTLLLVVTQSVFMIANIYRGLMWFILPTILVICNDISAYICGKLFGKTPLFKLSPRKTMEGFIGASIITILIAIFLGNFLSKYQIFICPQNNLLEAPFSMWSNLTCEPNLVYISQPYEVPLSLQPITGKSIIYISKAQVHAIFIGIFTAFVAPFGGFFASGFKRALHIKDFGTTIPGHGGITDRFDCQVLAGVFTFLYIRAFLFKNPKSFSLDFIISAAKLLSKPDIIRLISILEAHINSFNSTYSV